MAGNTAKKLSEEELQEPKKPILKEVMPKTEEDLEDTRGKASEILEALNDPRIKDILFGQKSDREEMAQRLENGELNGLDIDLRINQVEAIQKLIQFLRTTKDKTGYFLQPTGAGKTFLFGLISKLLDTQTIILVPSNVLVKQTKKEFINSLGFTEDEVATIESGKSVPKNAKVVISTYQSHISRLKIKGDSFDPDYLRLLHSTPLVVCDEAHRGLGEKTKETYKLIEDDQEITDEELAEQEEAILNISTHTSKDSLRLGFTATPKLSQKGVEKCFGKCIAKETHANLVKAGVLVPYNITPVEGEYEKGEITKSTTLNQESAFLEKEEMYEKLIEQWELKKEEVSLRTLVFCPTINGCDKFTEKAEEKGLRCKIVTSREKSENKNIVEEAQELLLNGEIDFIVTVNMLGEGYDCRPINSIILARATTSPAVKVQAAGRGARSQSNEENEKFGNKETCYVFEGVYKLKTSKRNKNKESKNEEESVKRQKRQNGGGYLRGDGKTYTLGDSLSILGEDIEDIVLNSEEIEQKKLLQFDENGVGTITLDDEEIDIVFLDAYLQNMPYIDRWKLFKYGDPKKLLLNKDLARFGEIEVEESFVKRDVDKIIDQIYEKEAYIDEEGIITFLAPYKVKGVVDLRRYLPKKLDELYLDEKQLEDFINRLAKHQIRSIHIPSNEKRFIDINGNIVAFPKVFDQKEIDDFIEDLRSGKMLMRDNIPQGNMQIEIIEKETADAVIAFTIKTEEETIEMPIPTNIVKFEALLYRLEKIIRESNWNTETLQALSDRISNYLDEIYDAHEKGGIGNARFPEQIIDRRIQPLIDDMQELIEDKITDLAPLPLKKTG